MNKDDEMDDLTGEKKYDLSPVKKTKSVEEQVDEVLGFKKLDESNPLERAEKFEMVKANPVKKDYMKIELRESASPDGSMKIVSKSEAGAYPENPFFTIDLNTLITGHINACPSNVVPMLIEQAKQMVRKEKVFRHEKRDKEFPWGWVIIGLSFVPAIILLIFWLI
jgi:hypothetical protein